MAAQLVRDAFPSMDDDLFQYVEGMWRVCSLSLRLSSFLDWYESFYLNFLRLKSLIASEG